MADGTAIEWTDATWNVVNGCTVHSAGCTNCYAMKQAHRVEARRGLTRKTNGGMVWTGEVRFNDAVLTQPLRWKRPRRIFVCAHGDLFHESVPDEWIDRVFAVMALAPQHQFQVLTKRADRMRAYLTAARSHPVALAAMAQTLDSLGRNSRSRVGEGCFIQGDFAHLRDWPLPNVWLGVSVEDQRAAEERIPALLATPAAVRFLSCEPLLGRADLTAINDTSAHPGFTVSALTGWGGWDYPVPGPQSSLPKVQWVIAGGESGPKARPMHPDWVRSLRDQCAEAGVPFLFKQWGQWAPIDGPRVRGCIANRDAWPKGERPRAKMVMLDAEGRAHDRHSTTAPSIYRAYLMAALGKKVAGRLLDGATHDGFPS